jgi:hypothetical protein
MAKDKNISKRTTRQIVRGGTVQERKNNKTIRRLRRNAERIRDAWVIDDEE